MHMQLKTKPNKHLIMNNQTQTHKTHKKKEKYSMGVSDVEVIRVLDDDIVHVNGVEFGEISGERDEINGGAFVELEEICVAKVPLPPETLKDLLKRRVR